MIITNYANSSTREYMAAREIHFLVVIPSARFSSFPKVLKTAQQFALSLGRVRTAGSSVRDFLEGGDVVLELVGICGQDAGEFPSAMSAVDREIFVQGAQSEEITVSQSLHPPLPLSWRTAHSLCQEYLEKCSPCLGRPGTSLCLVKPHVIKDGATGALLSDIFSAGFEIEAMFSIHMSLSIVETLLGVYRTLLPSYSQSIQHLASGPVLALLISGGPGGGDRCVEAFRSLCGPIEPELGRIISPDSLRAKYGLDLVHNAVHCTDLAEDGEMETRFIFETLAGL
jgi:nucleoside diphosphate kinase